MARLALAWLSLITVSATANLIRDSITLLPPEVIEESNYPSVHRDRVAESNSMIARASLYKNSAQVMLEDVQKVYNHDAPTLYWTIYFGPQGIPVDPCVVAPFEKLIRLPVSTTTVMGDGNSPLPPTFPKGTWPELHGFYDAECLLKADGEAPPTLSCGHDEMIVDFEKDPRYKDAVQTCDNGLKYQRAYFTEYTACNDSPCVNL